MCTRYSSQAKGPHKWSFSAIHFCREEVSKAAKTVGLGNIKITIQGCQSADADPQNFFLEFTQIRIFQIGRVREMEK